MGFFTLHNDRHMLVTFTQLVLVTLALRGCVMVHASPGQSSFEFAAYCQKLCIWGRGGNLCRCNAVHFVGKRRTSISGSGLVSTAGSQRNFADESHRNDWLMNPVSVGELFNPMIVPSSNGMLVRSDTVNDDDGLMIAEMASGGRRASSSGLIVAEKSRPDYQPVDPPETLVDFDVRKGKGEIGETGSQQAAAESQALDNQNRYKASAWNKVRQNAVFPSSTGRRKKYSAARQEAPVVASGNEGNGPIINVFYRKPAKDGTTVKLTTFKSMTSSVPAMSSTEKR